MNTFVLIPRFLVKGKYVLYAILVLCLMALVIDEGLAMDYFMNPKASQGEKWFSAFRVRAYLITAILAYAVSTSLKVISEYQRNERQKKELQSEKFDAEISFLKSQVNPHFLFNTLNNIYSLAYKKSDQTAPAILKLSGMMRYMLYESDSQLVSLSNEIAYLEDYIQLQRIRISGKAGINFVVEGHTEGVPIGPLLLIPFVENAFKHGLSFKEYSEINIYLGVEQKNIHFRIENPSYVRIGEAPESSGIGLRNVVRRLNLLYEGKHDLIIKDDFDKYTVDLKIQYE